MNSINNFTSNAIAFNGRLIPKMKSLFSRKSVSTVGEIARENKVATTTTAVPADIALASFKVKSAANYTKPLEKIKNLKEHGIENVRISNGPCDKYDGVETQIRLYMKDGSTKELKFNNESSLINSIGGPSREKFGSIETYPEETLDFILKSIH